MQKNIIFLTFFIGLAICLFTSTKRIDPNNPPTASTGAPGEQTCMNSDCHTQGTPSGTIEVTGLPTTIAPNTSYQITVKTASTTGKTTGFQLTVLDADGKATGNFTANSKVNIGAQAGRQYPRNSSKTSFASGSASWTFDWKSPATITAANKTVNFYYAGIIGNGDGKEKGDGLAKGSKTIELKSIATIDAQLDAEIRVYPNPITSILNIDIQNTDNATALLYDIDGRQVKKMFLDAKNNINVADLPRGSYILHINKGEKFTTRQVVLH